MSHGGFLRQHSDDSELSSHIMHDYTQADLDEQTRGMLDFAVKLTKNPSGSKKADVERLRDLGLNDQQILSTVLITCCFNFMTRLADGLGVEVQEDRFEDAKRWMSADVQSMSWLMDRKEKYAWRIPHTDEVNSVRYKAACRILRLKSEASKHV